MLLALTPALAMSLHVRWHVKLGDVADSAPIVVGGRLFETDKAGTTYAIDATNGHILWRFVTHGPGITTSVPAYDASTNRLYAPGLDGYVHQLDPLTGRELHADDFPQQITFAPRTEKDASPLTIANGYLYAQTSGYVGDATPYVGHVVAIRLRDGTKHVFNALCSSRHELIDPASCAAQRAGMWSRAGVVVDPDPQMHGRIYVATGNGPFDARAGNYGDSILSLSADASHLLGYLTPANYDQLESQDLDLGSTSPALLPRQGDSKAPLLAVQGGKDSTLRLFDRAHLGGVAPALQTISLVEDLFAAPAVWRDSGGRTFVVLAFADGVRAFQLITHYGRSRLQLMWRVPLDLGPEGTSPAISSGIVFVAANHRLMGLDVHTGRRLGSSSALGAVHWEYPTVDGRSVYCSDESGQLTAFSF